MKQIYDVIVVGGGPAGIMAAMASGKLGADTLLIEKNGFLGGAATASVLGPISPFHYKGDQWYSTGFYGSYGKRSRKYRAYENARSLWKWRFSWIL